MLCKGRLLMAAGLFLLLAAGCAPKGVPSPPSEAPGGALEEGGLFELRDGALAPLDEQAFMEWASEADYVLLGEGHTVACDHKVQAALLRLLAAGGRRWSLGLEMLSADLQPEIEAVNRDLAAAARDVSGLERTLRWGTVWGYPFKLYAPPLQAALEEGMPMVALNVPRAVLVKLRKKGRESLTVQEAGFLPKRIVPPMEEQKKSLRQVFAMHQEFMAGKDKDSSVLNERLEHFILVQSLWDTAMAERAAAEHRLSGRPMAILAGSGHVENGWGIAHRLREIDPGAKVLLVMPWRGGAPPAPGLADVFFHCPDSHMDRTGMTLAWDNAEEHALVLEVAPGSPAASAGLRRGDMILEAGGAAVKSLGDLHMAGVKAVRAGQPLLLVIYRNGYRLLMRLPTPKRSAGADAS